MNMDMLTLFIIFFIGMFAGIIVWYVHEGLMKQDMQDEIDKLRNELRRRDKEE